ncbi:MAG: hypothetical protein JEZ00_17695 [Anaerolineaceae bacterium]|nr:hypothetical protein [Anaerolineaceae bacterium]
MSSEERLKVLKMVSDGIISVEEADKLLEVLNEAGQKEEQFTKNTSSEYAGKKKGKWVRIVVSDTKSGKQVVNLRLPSKLVSAGAKIGTKFAPELEGIDTGELMEALNQDVFGKIIDVVDEKDGEHVEIYVE